MRAALVSSAATSVGCGPDQRLPLVGPGEEQQVVGELREPVGLHGGVADRLGQLLAAAAGPVGELELGA